MGTAALARVSVDTEKTAASVQVSIDTEKMQNKVSVDNADAVQNLKDAPTPLVIASDKSNQTPLVQVTANKSLQILDISTERDAKVLFFSFF